jgi:hypothetical protein
MQDRWYYFKVILGYDQFIEPRRQKRPLGKRDQLNELNGRPKVQSITVEGNSPRFRLGTALEIRQRIWLFAMVRI